MESYQISFNATPTGGRKNLPASGDLFVYESAAVATGAETRIKVKPANGSTIILKPGQWFRNPDPVTDWAMESYNGNDVIDAVFVIGAGEFGDANTLNKFTLDASFANKVEVTNTPANRVNVAFDPNYTINTTAPIMAYTNAKSGINIAAAAATVVVTAAENVNGVIIEQQTYVSTIGSLLAKATAPTSGTDGDYLDTIVSSAVQTKRIKVAAGKAVWVWSSSGAATLGNFLYTLL